MTSESIDQERCSLSEEMIRVEKKLVRKLDYIYVMPCLCLLTIVQFFDKGALNYSSVLGIREDNYVTDFEFGWLGSIFFIGYLVFQIPNAYFVQKLHLGKYLGVITVLWGIVLGVTSASKNFTHLAVLRFLLGVFEAGVLSCAYMLVSRLYRRKEQAARIGAIYFSGGAAIAIGGILCYGIGHMNGVAGLRAWQWVMIILGCGTVAFGIVCYFLLIDDATAVATCNEELELIKLRTKDNAVILTREINTQQILEALKECRFYCFSAVCFFVSLQNGALSVFASIIMHGFGFSDLNTILLGIPPGVMYSIFVLGATATQSRIRESMLYVACCMNIIAITGLTLVLVIPINQAKLAGLYLCVAYVGTLVMVLTSVSNNVSGYTKKIFYNCSMVFFCAVGNFVGPQLMLPSQSPLYIGGMVTYIASNVICIACLLIARYSMLKVNTRRQQLDQKTEYFNDSNIDITDKQDEQFIYKL